MSWPVYVSCVGSSRISAKEMCAPSKNCPRSL